MDVDLHCAEKCNKFWLISMLTFLVLNGISINISVSRITEGSTKVVGKFGNPKEMLMEPYDGK